MTLSLPPVVRSLLRARGLTVASIGMLALGMGALVSTFALVDAAMLRQPPFEQANRLATLYMTRTGSEGVARRERFSYARIQLLRSLVRSFESVSNFSGTSLTLTGTGGADVVAGEIVAPSYFAVVRVRAEMGRFFGADEDVAAGAHPVVVLSHALWQRRFQGDPSVVGQALTANGVVFTVIGVAPVGFEGLSGTAQFWIPTTMAPLTSYADYLVTNQNFISVVGRLKDGVDLAQANAELAVLGTQINNKVPSAAYEPGEVMRASAMLLNDARIDATTRRSVLTLLAGVVLLYLLACANVINLLLARAATRQREQAVRTALGCSRARLLRAHVAEGMLLAVSGGALGLLLAYWVCAAVTVPSVLWNARNFYGSVGAFDTPSFDVRVMAFGGVLTLVTGMLIGWAPALSALNAELLSSLRAGARGLAPGSGTLRRPTLRGVVVAVEAALAMLLLVAGGLMITSFERMRRTDIGIDADRVLTFTPRVSEVRVPVTAAPAFIHRLLDAITQLPGVTSASVDGGAPANGSARAVLHIVGRPVLPDNEAPPINRHYIGPDHFRTLGMRVLSGRAFTESDAMGRAKVAVVSAAAARRFWPGENPLGKRVWFGGSGPWTSADSSAEVVGVVNDVHHDPLDQPGNLSEVYTPYLQFTYTWRVYFVKTAGDPLAMVPAIRNALAAIDPEMPLTEVQPLSDLIGHSWARHRFDAILFGGFAAVALLLATVGIYSVVSYAVAQRTREMGIRLALGARPTAIVKLVVAEGLVFPVLGLVAGVFASLAATRVLQASLYEIAPTDPVVFGATVSVLLTVSALACVAPAIRATRVDPTEALRAE